MKNRANFFLFLGLIFLGILWGFFYFGSKKKGAEDPIELNQKDEALNEILGEGVIIKEEQPIDKEEVATVKEDLEVKEEPVLGSEPTEEKNQFKSPLVRTKERVTKKNFGVLIDPKNSPVQPERFAGYHTGTDFEVFREELEVDVLVTAICSGTLKLKRYATGYGGVVVQECIWEDQPITVVYGHLKLTSVVYKLGEEIVAGEVIGVLGEGGSAETDGERKHLHLGIHKGSDIELKGYVALANDLNNWIDPCSLVCKE